MQTSPLAVIQRIDVGLELEQFNQTLLTAFLAGQMQRRAVLLVLSFKIGSVLDQLFDDVRAILTCGQM